jgi:GSCFA family protein
VRLTLEHAIQNARSAGHMRLFPAKDDPRVRHGAVFPELAPRFSFAKGSSLFTLGSCFARTVEEKLPGFSLPTTRIAALPGERPGRPNGILNEYNPGTMCQRIERAASGTSFGDACIAPERDGYIDLLLPEHVTPATKDRLLARRGEVDAVYRELASCQAVIVTLDLVEAWYDVSTGLYVNRMPPTAFLLADRGRFELHVLDVTEVQRLLERMIEAFLAISVNKILLTISPAPLEATYSGQDCAIANAYSKSVLVVSAHHLSRRYSQVDYFPGYEIVTSAGAEAYEADAAHVQDELVERVTNYLVERYAR